MTARSVLITGATGDIGAAVARRVAREGDVPVIASRDIDSARVTSSGIPGSVAVEIDVLDLGSCERAVGVAQAAGDFRGLVCSAGAFTFGDAFSLTAAGLREMLDVNVVGTLLPAQAAASALVASEASGSLVLVSSSAGQRAVGAPAYATSKGAVEALMRELALAFAPHDIRVNVVSPGIIESKMSREALDTPSIREAFMAHTPLGRPGQVDEVAEAVHFMLSDASSFVTGTILAADGGFLSR